MDTSFFDRSEIIKSTRRGMHVAFRAEEGNAKKDRFTLPFTVDMILYAINVYLDTSRIYGLAIATAMVLAFVCLLRISEYTRSNNNHFMRAEDVVFVVCDSFGENLFVHSTNIHRYCLVEVIEVVVTVRSAKNDTAGEGHRFCFAKKAGDSEMAFDLVSVLYEWACVARPSKGQMFFSAPATKFELKADHMNSALKKVAIAFDFPGGLHFSSHSLRIGGASALAAAGVPDYITQKTGRWKSLAFLQYIRLASKAFNDAISVMCKVSTLTSNDVKKISASCTVI